MVQPGRDQSLLLEPLPHAGQGSGLGSQDLHRSRALEAFVESVEHAGHAALTEESFDAVAASYQWRRARLHRGCVPAAPLR